MQTRPQSLDKALKEDKKSESKLKDNAAQQYFKQPTSNEYIKKILNDSNKEYLTNGDFDKLKEAYNKAHDIRKFEIDLYWKRTSYLWTLIAALITVSGVLLASYYRLPDGSLDKKILLWLVAGVASLGVITTVISSKILESGEYWQKNWEYHVNVLEPLFSGSLYGTLLNSKEQRYSISKLNHAIYIMLLTTWMIVIEVIYFVAYKNPDFLGSFLPIIGFGLFNIILSRVLDAWTKSVATKSKVKMMQWNVEIIESTTNNNEEPSRMRLSTIILNLIFFFILGYLTRSHFPIF
ncbi:RipA family octameric membrane protein [Pantoea agglomerans]|uniref:Uncharacterized protein n=1 Tax=Enterobacter agglomerans TaxID=549 RepID=A0AAN2K5E0_ENTAG|nr:hypothetical protein [Pantoea agglomerans]CAH6297210.1 hypothetical protein DAPPPG734_11850 [Pantoea agglomerans]